ncbi:MAG: hypothetical protein R3249_09390 [Nitriliruptorales bacterium]|nr:hypothetical protein [Nitriliruptorales bacterium]
MGDESAPEVTGSLDDLDDLVATIAEQPVDEHPRVYAQLDDDLSRRLADLDDLD